ncbi:hypothetical protein ACGFZK_36595 [Streptomyces sp. NPDC048257]|uniref:hypothetical protein n=1 Tax=Streptomyces sp. NPDC048257 TaxID=3365526 RepID=UPI0037109AAA
MTAFAGRWKLLAAVSHHPGVAYECTDGSGTDAVIGGARMDFELLLSKWLAGETLDREPAFERVAGLTLEIGADLTFTEAGAAAVEWFCEEGVLESKAAPFDGRIVTTPAGNHLLLHASPAEPYSEDDDVLLRLDDGDTKITDIVALRGERLYRTVSVGTDEMYVCRLPYEYERA